MGKIITSIILSLFLISLTTAAITKLETITETLELEPLEEEDPIMITSPTLEEPYTERRIRLTIESEEECDLEYTDYNFYLSEMLEELIQDFKEYEVPFGKYRRLCRNCDSYDKQKNFKEGFHSLNIRCKDHPEINATSYFIIDSKGPRISKTYPRRNKFTNGSDFSIKYIEDQPVVFYLNVTEEINTMKFDPFFGTFFGIFFDPFGLEEDLICEAGRNKECHFELDIEELDGEEIEYQFMITDIAGNIESSRPTTVTVDTTPPKSIDPKYSFDKRRVEFLFLIDEINFDKITYIDNNDKNPREKILCSRLKEGKTCSKTKSFRKGDHDLTILVKDKAGNTAKPISLEFTCDKRECFRN